ncbi:hypothetical protein C0J52_16536 [Blattella germanica]|nr:hypothetical protein C0J52_16536 [Blattella germanica]
MTRSLALLLALVVLASVRAFPSSSEEEVDDHENDKSFWINKAQATLSKKLNQVYLERRAKNVIFFLGDGMSIPTLAAARIYQGQLEGKSGEESQLSFEKFPFTGLSKTYCVNSQVADSACSATAYLGGVKGNIGTIGVNARVQLSDCAAMKNTSNHVSSVLHWSQKAGKSTGIVTTTTVTHASPSGNYAHTANRNWESPDDVVASLFKTGNMKYHWEADPYKYPTLEEMTRVAIEVLRKNERGFFLFVEGGRIDHGHHATTAHIAVDETLEFAKAIQAAVDLTNEKETLIVVTSDHGHTMTFSGYPARGNNIFHTAGTSSGDGFPYSTLSYANGPGYKPVRHDISTDNMDAFDYQFPASVPLSTETHDGSDVGIFARGPFSHLFTGVIEQNVIPHLIAYASCVGSGRTYCRLHKENIDQ